MILYGLNAAAIFSCAIPTYGVLPYSMIDKNYFFLVLVPGNVVLPDS